MTEKEAYFAGGCFWCITPAFARTEGVLRVRSGYCGGTETDPAYADVKAQRTGHRETIRIIYDAEKVTYRELLHVFLDNVDPYDDEGQFIDRGRSYTLAVYCSDERERGETESVLAQFERKSGRRPFVSVELFSAFYEAEDYHQDFYLKEPEAFHREMVESGRIRE